ncbi:MAG TPA: GAP family protein [Mycobacterium sp.]|nr:GAP family protein [Mycobacterium sp.]
MGELWVTMLPAAIAIAVSPTGIIEMILVLLSARARLNAAVFFVSVMVSVFLLPLLGASILRAWVKSGTAATAPSAVTAWLLIGLGVLLIVSAVVALVRPATTTPPAVFGRIAGMGPGAVFLLSLTVVWFNPINALILLTVGSQAASMNVPIATLLLSLAAFTLLASAPFAAVVVVLEWGGERATAALERFRRWLVDHYRVIMAVILGLLGLMFLAQGVASLPG